MHNQILDVPVHQCTQHGKQTEEKQEVQSKDLDLIAITEMWWDSSHDWNVAMKGYILFRRNFLGEETPRMYQALSCRG